MTKVRKKIGTIPINDIEQQVQQATSDAIAQMQQEVSDFIDEETAQYPEIGGAFKFQEDPEKRSEITTDSEGKIISYRDASGTMYENVGITTKHITANTINVCSIIQSGIPEQTDKEYIYIDRPKYGELWFYGVLPTDTSDERTPTELKFVLKVNNDIKLSANCTLAIQGNNSASFLKKGYTFEPLNINGDALEIKFGDMIATDSFHLKAFMSDHTQAKDVCGYKVWERLVKSLDYPYNKFNNIPFHISSSFNKNKDAVADAQYHPDGFPVAFYLNDEFHGLYTLRLKKSRQNYAMEKSEKSMIFLDATGAREVIEGVTYYKSKLSEPFIHEGWELKNPKIKGYVDGGEITDSDVLASINRLFDFTSNLATQWENYADYIVLPHWLTFIIAEELLISIDCCYNNINLLTWDNTHWSIFPYDLDYSLGNKIGEYVILTPEQAASMTVTSSDIYPTFKQLFNTEIRELYTKFRRNGIITTESLFAIYVNQTKYIPREIYNDDLKKWGTIYSNGYITIEYLKDIISTRISYLDSIWLNQEANN